MTLVLASQSVYRRAMMEAAGLVFACDAAHVDEGAVKDALRAEGAPVTRATEALAELKARRVDARHGGALVLGADSMLECEGRWFDKAATVAEARDHLLALRGREHSLVTTAVLVRDGARLWHHTAVARLTMRRFSQPFLDRYLAAIGETACSSVGCYQIEGLGLQLFARIEGDFYAIVGLPMVALLEQLRVLGEIET